MAGATFEHVASSASVTRGALHHHFRSKTSLLEAALAWGWSEYGARLFDENDDASLEAPLLTFVDLLREDPLFRALAASTVLVAPQALDDAPTESTAKNVTLDSWRDQIAATIPDTSELAPDAVARLVLVLLQGLTVTAVTRPRDLPQPGELSATITALVRGLLT
ncbi:MAG: TetR/AcrR family transcriptional regulator [Leucobacter sp.]